jgi:hypothetical protein
MNIVFYAAIFCFLKGLKKGYLRLRFCELGMLYILDTDFKSLMQRHPTTGMFHKAGYTLHHL